MAREYSPRCSQMETPSSRGSTSTPNSVNQPNQSPVLVDTSSTFLSPWRYQFDNARDTYAARNALGVASDGGVADAPSDGTLYARQNATWAAAQPADADLTAIAALSGTNTIYYRSGAGVWSPGAMRILVSARAKPVADRAARAVRAFRRSASPPRRRPGWRGGPMAGLSSP